MPTRLRPTGLRSTSLLAFVLMALAGSASAAPNESETAATPEPEVQPWLLAEFDWGDTPEIVIESVEFTPGYICHKLRGACKMVKVRVGGEDLLGRFQYVDDSLWRIAFVTPALDLAAAMHHGPRVLERLVAHVREHKGEPKTEAGLPDLAGMELGQRAVTHAWADASMEIRVQILRTEDGYYVGAYFADPARAEALRLTEPDPADRPNKRKRRAKEKARKAQEAQNAQR